MHGAGNLTVAIVRTLLQEAEPAALLVEARILRRVVRLDRRLPGFGLAALNRKSYCLERDRLLSFVDRDEVELPEGVELPRLVILLARSDEESFLDVETPQSMLRRYERLLFRESVRVELLRRAMDAPSRVDWAAYRARRLGAMEFAEAQAVLLRDEHLFPSPTELETYVEFVCQYLDFRYYSPDSLPAYFPGVRDWEAIARCVAEDVDHARIHERLQASELCRSAADATGKFGVLERSAPAGLPALPHLPPADFRRWQAQAESAAALGNCVKAALIHTRAALRAPPEFASEAHAFARAEMRRLATRLHAALEIDRESPDSDAPDTLDQTTQNTSTANDTGRVNEAGRANDAGVAQETSLLDDTGRAGAASPMSPMSPRSPRSHAGHVSHASRARGAGDTAGGNRGPTVDDWQAALVSLLAPAARGFWTNEGRLLYDLQKVCMERERGVFRVDLVEWVRTFGARPLRRPLPLLRDALVVKHLKTARRRVATARVAEGDRERLMRLVRGVLARSEQETRRNLRPVVTLAFNQVGLAPDNIPERVAQRKIVEELLDAIVEHSHISFANLRDAVSKNDLKLPDVESPRELIRGDRLLRADRKLDRHLDGIYRRAAVYQRWPQRISSLVFGTPIGRLITKHAALPYGSAFLALEFLRHLTAGIVGNQAKGPDPSADPLHDLPHMERASNAGFVFYAMVAILGTWLSLVIHRADFREWNIAQLRRLWHFLRILVIEVPQRIVNSPVVRRVLESHWFSGLWNYLLRPGLTTAALCGAAYPLHIVPSRRLAFEIFLIVNLFLNSPGGRYLTEIAADFLVRLWHELTARVFASVVQWIIAVFQALLVWLERVVYVVDEWLLFRRGDRGGLQVFKLLGGVAWFFVSYLVVFVFTLLVEPQINPIKHFPVVTVSHKLILPTGPLFVKQLTPYLGPVQANTLVWTTIWLIPGVFGFLVWELKENWRLYVANRARGLRRTAIGQHGESMVRLLRTGFHSGTIPKAYTALRKAIRKSESRAEAASEEPRGSSANANLIQPRWDAVRRVQRSIQRFVERELIAVLEEARFLQGAMVSVDRVEAANFRADVHLACAAFPGELIRLTWEDLDGVLSGGITADGWLARLGDDDRETLNVALSGLFQRAGVDRVQGPIGGKPLVENTWQNWSNFWSLTATLNSTAPSAH